MEKSHKKWGGVLSDTSIKSVLAVASQKIATISDSPALDAELLLAHCLKKNRTYLHTWPEEEINEAQLEDYITLVKQRLDDYPVAYLLGKQSFWTLELKVTPDVLIPRPETELLVETALQKIASISHPKVLDLGTGSGAIALAIAAERKNALITATDQSAQALAIAADNARQNKLSPIGFIQSDWFKQLPRQSFDLIVSNPPYIDPDDPHLKQSIRHEPQQALVANNQGMSDIESIIKNSPAYLKHEGWLIIEHGYNQGKKTRKLLLKNSFHKVETRLDLNRNERITLGQVPEPI